MLSDFLDIVSVDDIRHIGSMVWYGTEYRFLGIFAGIRFFSVVYATVRYFVFSLSCSTVSGIWHILRCHSLPQAQDTKTSYKIHVCVVNGIHGEFHKEVTRFFRKPFATSYIMFVV